MLAAIALIAYDQASLRELQPLDALAASVSGDARPSGDRAERVPDPDPTPKVEARPAAAGGGGPKTDGEFTEVKGGKVLALSFDDGPGPLTPEILDVLDEYDATATFFVLGRAADAQPGVIRDMVERGHQVEGHTWSHPDLTGLSGGAWDDEVDRTNALVEELTGTPVTCLRPPFGAHNSTVRERIRDRGLDLAMWSNDSRDWQRPGAGVIASRVIDGFSPGDVILLHDGGGDRSQTLAALDDILSAARQQGYGFVHTCR